MWKEGFPTSHRIWRHQQNQDMQGRKCGIFHSTTHGFAVWTLVQVCWFWLACLALTGFNELNTQANSWCVKLSPVTVTYVIQLDHPRHVVVFCKFTLHHGIARILIYGDRLCYSPIHQQNEWNQVSPFCISLIVIRSHMFLCQGYWQNMFLQRASNTTSFVSGLSVVQRWCKASISYAVIGVKGK